jgi:hypothetical protein
MDKISEWFGSGVCEQQLQRVRNFWAGAERHVASINTSKHYYRQVHDQEEMLRLAVMNLEAQARLPGLNLPAFCYDTGTVSTAKYWGGRFEQEPTTGNEFIHPVAQTVEEALALPPPLPVDHPDMDAAAALRHWRRLGEVLETDKLWLRTCDFQGPFNTAGLIMNQEELLMAMYADPDAVRLLLERVTNHLIAFGRYFINQTGSRVCGSVWPYTFLPSDLGVSFTEDLMPLMSAELYREFAAPYLRRLSTEFGGLHIHCCGQWGRHAETLRNSGACIRAVEFHYPFTKIEEIACLAPDTVFVPCIALEQQSDFSDTAAYFEHLLRTTPENCRFWFFFPVESPEAEAFARRHGF